MIEMIKREALPVGSIIDFCGERGEVIRDDGGDRIDVIADGFHQRWFWTLEGVSCTVVALPAKDKEP